MKKSLKNTVLKLMYFAGVNRLLRWYCRKNPRIIMLHKIVSRSQRGYSSDDLDVDEFERLIKYIAAHYNSIRVSELAAFKKTYGSYPENAIAVTFDDGFQSFYDIAFPILQRHQVPATIYVCPMLVEHKSWIWPDCMAYLYQEGFSIHTSKTLEELLSQLKNMSSIERNGFIKAAACQCDVILTESVPEVYRLMSWEMLLELAQSPLIEIGSHTLSHPILSKEDVETARREIFHSKKILQDKLDTSIESFCFPNGHPSDYNLEHCAMLKEAGYSCAVASHFGHISGGANEMALPRISVGGSTYSNYKYLDGIEYFQRKVFNDM
jgi:peptidoglycan/xylan/chitin deacetylase (PgdA/CDA1 family)